MHPHPSVSVEAVMMRLTFVSISRLWESRFPCAEVARRRCQGEASAGGVAAVFLGGPRETGKCLLNLAVFQMNVDIPVSQLQFHSIHETGAWIPKTSVYGCRSWYSGSSSRAGPAAFPLQSRDSLKTNSPAVINEQRPTPVVGQSYLGDPGPCRFTPKPTLVRISFPAT